MKGIVQLLVVSAALAPTAALAHPALGGSGGFAHGLTHPLSGLDHQLAMVLVGIFAYQLGGRAVWALPLTFVGAMALGGVLGAMGVALPYVEIGIALSVIVLGAAVAFGLQAPLASAIAAIGLFAIFHGHAHGTELPVAASGLAFGLGFMLATAALHAIGIGLGYAAHAARRPVEQRAYRFAGGLVSITGVILLAGAI